MPKQIPKWIRNLNRKRKLKNTEGKHEFCFKKDCQNGEAFSKYNPKPKSLKQRTEMLDYTKIKHLCIAKTAVNQTKDISQAKDIFLNV